MEICRYFLDNYFNFNGRMNRANYLIYLVLLYGPLAVFGLLGETGTMTLPVVFEVLMPIYAFFIFVPTIAFTWRRLHDRNKSGWWSLVWGVFLLFVLLSEDSEANNYGHPEEYSPFQNKSWWSLIWSITLFLGMLALASMFGLIIMLVVGLIVASSGSPRRGKIRDKRTGKTYDVEYYD